MELFVDKKSTNCLQSSYNNNNKSNCDRIAVEPFYLLYNTNMAIISFSEVIKLKDAVSKNFGEKVHFHDACGGQYFTLEKTDKNLQKFITNFMKDSGFKTVFDDDGLSFILSK